jgi:hypothetical protein
MGPVTRHMPHGHWPVKHFDLVKGDIITTRTHRWSSNLMIHCELGCLIAGKRFSGSRRVRGYQPRWVLTLRASPAASPSGGACQWQVLKRTRTRIEDKRGLGVSEAHRECDVMLGEARRGQNRRHARRWAPTRDKEERLAGADWGEINLIPSVEMFNTSRRSFAAARRVFGWPRTPARYLIWS